MDIEHQKFLFEQFAFLRPKENDDTPLKVYGIECGDGWLGVITKLCRKIESLNMRNFQVTQIKEKFGTICFYFENAPKRKLARIIEYTNEAQADSGRTCEVCGAPGRLKKTKWLILTRCSYCTNK